MDHGEIRRLRHDPAQSVDLADHRALRHTADSWVARHLTNGLESAGDQSYLRAKPGGREGSFGTGVTGTDDDYIELALKPWKYNHRLKISMPIELAHNQGTILIRRGAFERAGLTRSAIDERYNLTDAEFHVEEDLVSIGPLPSEDMIPQIIDELEQSGLTYFDDFFDLSGNWPDWLTIYVRAREPKQR